MTMKGAVVVSAMEERESAETSERQRKEAERDSKLKSFQGERLTPHSLPTSTTTASTRSAR